MKKLLFTFIFGFLFCQIQGQSADRVFQNGVIYTSNDDQPFAEAIAILGDTIMFVGSNADANAYIGSGTLVHDLEGKLILPGLHDVHTHVFEVSGSGEACILDSWAWTTQELADELNACNPEANINGWIFSWGHSIYTILEGSDEMPKTYLDEYFPDTPVAAMEETSHSAWVNSKALELLGIDADTPDPIGGHIVKDSETGEPTGVLLDSAGDWAFDEVFASHPTLDEDNYQGMVDFGFPTLAQNGITSIVEGRTYWKRDFIETWQDLHDNGEMTARVVLAPYAYPDDEDATQIEILASFYDEGDELLRIQQIKLYVDGITIEGTAALDQPYIYTFGWPFDNGLNYFSEDRLEEYITELEVLGFDFFIHAIGNRGVEEALNAIEGARETNGDIGARHRVTHLEVVNTEEYPRFAELGVIADGQVAANWTNPDQWSQNNYLIGAELSDNMIPIKSIFEEGGMITLSSDYDVSTMNPFRGMQNALTRAPQNLPNLEEIVKAYTINGAYVMRQEDITGSLEVGKYADLICVNQNIFEIPQNQIFQTDVTLTMLGGEIVYETNDFPDLINENTLSNSIFVIAPNVVSSLTYFHVRNSASENYKFEIYTSDGKLIRSWNQSIESQDQLVPVDVSDLAEGIYTVNVLNSKSKQISTKKLVVSR